MQQLIKMVVSTIPSLTIADYYFSPLRVAETPAKSAVLNCNLNVWSANGRRIRNFNYSNTYAIKSISAPILPTMSLITKISCFYSAKTVITPVKTAPALIKINAPIVAKTMSAAQSRTESLIWVLALAPMASLTQMGTVSSAVS
jgi:hypothetical protein